jgi:hypothetical protein
MNEMNNGAQNSKFPKLLHSECVTHKEEKIGLLFIENLYFLTLQKKLKQMESCLNATTIALLGLQLVFTLSF